ncbi:MAG TPA: DUF1003 domain-containing protein [Terriglobales bacterium]|nr:DUF1003 domain-containing protein [Terriglobales bacterium]
MSTDASADRRPNTGDIDQVLESNIELLLERRRREDRERRLRDRISDTITSFAGSMTFVYLHLLLFGTWIGASQGWLPLPRFDPTLVTLAMFASVEAIFLSTFVLITQNRMNQAADRRADLDLQVSLLSEHEITRILTLVRAIASHLSLPEAHDASTTSLLRDVGPDEVLDTIERKERE